MKKINKTALLLLCCLMGLSSLLAQKGIVRGTITDQASGEALMFTNVLVLETNPPIGAQTDLDGNYELQLNAGVYALEVSYVGYMTKTITEIEVKAGEITIVDFPMADESLQLTEVVVSSKRIDRTENALLALQKKSFTIQDGISSQEMSRFGTSSAAESVKRVSGAAIVGGKYINVRGLGDRYASAQLNNMPLPSTNPYRNSTPLDLIPSNLLENIIISKSFTPDQSGSFTGGNVNLKTKSFPETFTLSFSSSVTYNTISSFNDRFLSYTGGKNDWLGYDDGTRALPAILQDPTVREQLTTSSYIRARKDDELAAVIDEASKSLNAQKSPTHISSPLNHSLSFSVGNQFQVANNPLGVLFGVNYRRSYTALSNYQAQNWELPGENATALNNNFRLTGDQGTENPQVGGLLNLAYKFAGSNKISFNAFYNHDAEKTATFLSGPYSGIIAGANEFETRSLLFKERELASLQLNGEHVFPDLGNIKLEWGGSLVELSQEEPDLRFFANTFNLAPDDDEGAQYFISPSEYDLPFHYFRTLTDEQKAGRVDISIPFAQANSPSNNIKFGLAYSKKDRTFDEDRFQIQTKSNNFDPYNNNPEAFFAPQNTGFIGKDSRDRNLIGLYVTDEEVVANTYTGTEEVLAAYGMFSYDFRKFRIVGGLRIETTDFTVESADENKQLGRIDELDWLPSVNLIYRLSSDMNVRASFNQTLARPNMREIAPFSAFDFIGGPTFTGNPALQRTLAQNFDIRWELFPNIGEVFAVSAYYKNFTNPIITRYLPESQNPEIKPENVDQGRVYGVELEFRKSLAFLSKALRDFKLATNLSFINSEIEIPEEERAIIQRLNPEFGDMRPFQGQSPYLLNVALTYTNLNNGLDAALSLNVFGDRLSEVSLNGTPDIYEQARPQLDFSIKKTFANRYSLKLGVQNILDTDYRKTMSYKNADYIFQQYQRGISYNFGFSYNIK